MTASADEIGTTPDSWRQAALGILVGGFGVGLLAGHKKLGKWVPLITSGIAVGCAVPVALASRRPPIEPGEAADALDDMVDRPAFSIVVGARDEAVVLRQLVSDVSRQDYGARDGSPLFELIVVDDRSTDGTAEAVAAAARDFGIADVTRVVTRRGEGLADGKGAALTAAQPDICTGDIVLVLDADARLEPWFLRRAAGYFAAGASAVTARRRILNAESSWLAGAQADEQTLDGELNRGRWALGGCSEFRGNGIMIRRDLLASVGGWRASALTEDIDLSSRIAAAAGERVAWALDAEVWEEPVRSAGHLWRQRLRWAEGAFRRAFEHGPAVMSSEKLPIAARLDFLTYVGQLAVPPVVLGAATASLITGRRRSLVSIVAGYLGISAFLGWDAMRWERRPDGTPLHMGERVGRALRVSVFNGLWLAIVPRVLLDLTLRRGPIEYVKMDHDGAGHPTELPARAAARDEVVGAPR
ncbi:MAG TPA: glycosyltransferase family 2 protein [Candidatus Limnocylindrales bacterium]